MFLRKVHYHNSTIPRNRNFFSFLFFFGHGWSPVQSLTRTRNMIIYIGRGAGIACWLDRRTRDRKVADSNPGRSGGRIFFARVNFFVLNLIRCPFHPRVTAVARKRPRSFYQKCRWQVTLKHAHTLDPTKSKWADYAAVRACVGTYQERSSNATRQGILGHSRLSSLGHCGLILAKEWN